MCVHNTSNSIQYAAVMCVQYIIILSLNITTMRVEAALYYVRFKSHEPIDNMLVPLYIIYRQYHSFFFFLTKIIYLKSVP